MNGFFWGDIYANERVNKDYKLLVGSFLKNLPNTTYLVNFEKISHLWDDEKFLVTTISGKLYKI